VAEPADLLCSREVIEDHAMKAKPKAKSKATLKPAVAKKVAKKTKKAAKKVAKAVKQLVARAKKSPPSAGLFDAVKREVARVGAVAEAVSEVVQEELAKARRATKQKATRKPK
jgi:hypothetical protein